MKRASLSSNDLISVRADRPIIIFGADICGRLIARHLAGVRVSVYCFVDNNSNKCGQLLEGLPVHTVEVLTRLPLNTIFLVASTYYNDIFSQLNELGFSDIHPTFGLLNEIPETEINALPSLEGEVHGRGNFSKDFPLHAVSNMVNSQRSLLAENVLFIRSVDVIITERCSLKCQDCANLMQYYEKPVNVETQLLLDSLGDLDAVADKINEIRVIGGEPLVNSDFDIVIHKAASMKSVAKVVVYTNGTIVPSDDKLQSLSSFKDKLFFFITNYEGLSRKTSQLVDALNRYQLPNNCQDAYGWTECGSIGQRNRSRAENEIIFQNCCAKNFISMSDSRLYRCPFSANVSRLNGMPTELHKADGFDLKGASILSDSDLSARKQDLYNFLYNLKTLNACDFCAGRTYGDPEIKPGIQASKSLDYLRY